MTSASAPGSGASASGPGAVRRWWAPTIQALVLVMVVLTGAVHIDAALADIAADEGAGPAVAVQPVVRRVSPPVTLGIPRLKVTSRLIGLRKQNNGTLQVPADPQRAGWYSQGAAPGDAGPAVIVGHVDSFRGPGIFSQLKTMKKGDLIKIRRADGTLATFQVRLVRTYAKRNFPTNLVYVGDSRPSLRLITCGGAFDERSRTYLSNTVVFAAAYKAPAAKRKVPVKRTSPVGRPAPTAPRVTPRSVAPAGARMATPPAPRSRPARPTDERLTGP